MKYFIHLPMKMEITVSSETSAIRTQTPGNYPKRNKLHLQHGESLKTRSFPSFVTKINAHSLFRFLDHSECDEDALPSLSGIL